MAKATKKQQSKIGKVMSKYKDSELHSGSKKGPKVTSKDQAIAIAMNEAGMSKNKSKKKKGK